MNEDFANVAEVISEQPQVVENVVKTGLPNAAYVGIGAAGALAIYGIGSLIWHKGIKPAINKLKEAGKADEEKKEETANEEKKKEETANEEKKEK